MKTHSTCLRFIPWLVLGALLLPAWTQADSLTNAMNAVTVRVLCVNPQGESGTGSGFTVGRGSHVVTNWHVVACTQEGGKVAVLLDINTMDGVEAEVRERDETKDLAVLRLERPIKRPDARFATLATLAQRDPVVAVGFPGDADEMGGVTALTQATLTEGVVGRLLPDGDGTGRPLVQVSAAINPGNSGGPLFDEAGRVVGINTMKSLAAVETIDPEGGTSVQRVVLGEGLGWAVASDALFPLLRRLGIIFEASHRRLLAPERWWHRDPVLVGALAGLGVLLLSILSQLSTQRGRARVHEGLTRAQEGFTRAIRREPARGVPTPRPGPLTQPLATPAPRPTPAVTPAATQAATPPVRQPVLRCLAGPYAGQTLPLAGRPIAIGRNPSLVQLVLPADQHAISQRHAVVGHDAARGGFYVEDCWSTNGVFLTAGPGAGAGGGSRIQAGQTRSLAPGSRFYLATPAISFEVNYQ